MLTLRRAKPELTHCKPQKFWIAPLNGIRNNEKLLRIGKQVYGSTDKNGMLILIRNESSAVHAFIAYLHR